MLDALAARAIAGFKRFCESYFSNFRIVEFTAAVGAAYTAMYQMAQQIGIPGDKSAKIALIGAWIGAFLYIRNPKTLDWKPADADSPGNNADAPAASE